MIMTQTPELRNEKPIALFIVHPRALAFKALRNTSDAKGTPPSSASVSVP